MKKLVLLPLIALFTGAVSAQNNANVHGNLHVHTGGNITFFGGVNVPEDGMLRNQAGTLYTRDVVTGETRIQIDEAASLNVDGGTFTFAHETNEKFLNLTVGTTGVVEIPAGRSLTTTGTFNNLRTGTPGVRLLANSTGYGQLLTEGPVTNKGILYAEQYLTSTTTAGWRHLSSPVATTLAALDDDIQTYYEAPGAGQGTQGITNQWNVWWYDASPATALSGADNPASPTSKANAKYYTPAQNNTEAFGPANNAKAYVIYTGGAFDVTNPDALIDVEGAFGNADYNFTLYKTHDKGPGAYAAAGVPQYNGAEDDPGLITGWNLIPNPYPSNLDVSAMVDGTAALGMAYQAIHVWDPASKQYIAISHDINTSMVEWNNNTGGLVANQNIAPFQAFWVKADLEMGGGSSTVTDQITLTNAHRTVATASKFFKQAPPHLAIRLWNNNQQKRDQALVAFDAMYNSALENNDAVKLLSSDILMPELSTLVEGIPTSINRMAMPAPGHAIPVRFKSKVDREPFHLGIAEHEIDLSWTIHVFDWHTKILHDLRADGPYKFTNDTKFEGDNRFTVYINYKDAGYDPLSNVRIWGGRNGIEVSFANPNGQNAAIEILDLAGRRLYYNNAVPTNYNFEWPVSSQVSMYVVRVSVDKKHTIEKVIR